MAPDDLARLMALYPRIFFACHHRHVVDPQTKRILSAHQASILDHLDEVEGMTLGDLARHMGVTPGTMSVHINRLAGRGYVRRGRDRRDARCVQLILTAAGVRIREARSVLDPERVRRLLACLSPREREEGLRGLALLAGAADKSVSESAAERKKR